MEIQSEFNKQLNMPFDIGQERSYTYPSSHFQRPQKIYLEKEKSHICEEGGEHPRISVWQLLMNLKNNYLLKKLLKWANKKCKYFNIKIKNNNKKNKEKHLEISLFYSCVPTFFMISSTVLEIWSVTDSNW